MFAHRILLALLITLATASSAPAQDKGSVDANPLPPLDNPKDPKIGAKQFFARKLLPSSQRPKVIGSYTNGCLAGGEQMPITGDTWQVMRLSRNRYWGYPETIALIKRLAEKAHKDAG
jgi:penicillin-insensitive murein DD-endopeptidase